MPSFARALAARLFALVGIAASLADTYPTRPLHLIVGFPAGIKTRLAELGSAPLIVTPQAFGAFLAAETEKWAKAVKFSGASID